MSRLLVTLLRRALKITASTGSGEILLFLWSLLFFSACTPSHKEEADRLNTVSYSYHYKDIDSTLAYARRALDLSSGSEDGRAEALNNLAFAHIARMDYHEAYLLLDSVSECTDNQIELLIADIQLMRLCQRESRNKEFYDYHERAGRRLNRIEEEADRLPERLKQRMIYARSEFSIVTSTYYYYVGLEKASADALFKISPEGEIQKDTAQYLSYLYQIGAGGIITEGTRDEIIQKEWDYLVKCYSLSLQSGDRYWEANAMQAMSEHLFADGNRDKIIKDNPLSVKYINKDSMPDSLLAGYLSKKSLDIFIAYGDVYQIAGAYRTLASCYWALGDYESAVACLENALDKNSAISQAPDLVASIRERLSLTYSAMGDKPNSDYNRNIYLDMQEQTRQDRFLEARAGQLNRNSAQLNVMIIAVVLMIVFVVFSIFLFDYLRRKKDRSDSLSKLLVPLQEWQRDNRQKINELNEKYEEINEEYGLTEIHISDNKKRNVENRARIFLVNSIMPLIDRMLHEIDRLATSDENVKVRDERFAYIAELTDRINVCNTLLTQWIQLQQGRISLHIESFPLRDVFDIVLKNRMSFRLKGIELIVDKTDCVVKADRILTLFMINTIADNARKFTPEGGTVRISSVSCDDYVEISVTDTGQGIDEERLATIFDHKVSGGHGFGLMNCKGIIEKYRKISKVFDVCRIFAESGKGKGSRFSFRLPKGIVRLLLLLFPLSAAYGNNSNSHLLDMAGRYADSAYYCNINGTYTRTVQYADSARECLNKYYISKCPAGKALMTKYDRGGVPAEIIWFHDSLKTDYGIILDIRNETAVAALALNDWRLYYYNNSVYTQLYKETSADNSLGGYVRIMQRSEINKTIAVILLLLLLIVIIVAYYMLYYRHRLYFRYCVEQIDSINDMLKGETSDSDKLERLDTEYSTQNFPDSLKNIVEQIRMALADSVKAGDERMLDIEMLEDELHRAEYENQKLYISNNVLDNCLSTLKHETMYYPSRIRLLLDNAEDNLNAIRELAVYYKQLYSILSMQATRQTENISQECRRIDIGCIKALGDSGKTCGLTLLGDMILINYLFEILQKQSGDKYPDVDISLRDSKYVDFRICMPSVRYRDIFVPSAENIPFMICRQIVRENSESTGQHGCGIVADRRDDGSMDIVVTLAGCGRKILTRDLKTF